MLKLLHSAKNAAEAGAPAEGGHAAGHDAHAIFAQTSLMVTVVVSIALYFDYKIKKNKFFYLPESAASMLFGTILGVLICWTSTPEQQVAARFNSSLFFFILLPPIIFEAGYTIKQGNFFKNFGTIILYAVGGTLISTFIVGYGLYALAVKGIVPLDSSDAIECLLFGSLISATDPVATLTLMGSPLIGAPPVLYALVFGEAVLNDAVAIVLYQSFEAFLSVQFDSTTVAQAMVKFAWVSFGSLGVGVAVGLMASFMFKQTNFKSLPHFEITLTLLFAFSSYFMSEALHLSGIMALFFCGLTLAHYNTTNISEITQHATHDAFKSLAQICETFVFVYLGITIGLSAAGTVGDIQWSASLSFFTLLFCLIGRACNTFPLTWWANRSRRVKIPFRMQICIWFSGLRGAIAFALSLQVPTSNGSVIMTSTLVVVVITTFIFGGLTEPMLRLNGMKGYGAKDPNAPPRPPKTPEQKARSLELKRAHMSGLEKFWLSFDNMYMKYWFGGVINEEFAVYREALPAEQLAHGHDDSDSDDEEPEVAVESVEMEVGGEAQPVEEN